MKKIVYLIILGLCFLTKAQAQIVAGEYFWNIDPGVGLATPFTAPEIATGAVDESFALNITTPTTAGQHILFVRFKQNDTLWSQAFPQSLFIGPENLLAGAVSKKDTLEAKTMEHYWNDASGSSVLTALPASDANFNLTVGLSTSGASLGSNTFNYRIKDKFGLWTGWAKEQILIMGQLPLPTLDSIKFAIKPSKYSLTGDILSVNFKDPNDKLNLTLNSIPSDPNITVGSKEISTVGLSNGIHILSFRSYANAKVVTDISASDTSALYQMAVMVDNTIMMNIGEPRLANNTLSTQFCPGGIIKIPIDTTGNWPRNHPGIIPTFAVKLSNNLGQNFVTISSQMNMAGDTLVATIPANNALGTGFKVMVESTNPMIRDTASSTLTIGLILTASATNPIVCEAGTLNLAVSSNVAASYSWTGPAAYTGSGSTPSRLNIPANGGGSYSVTSVSTVAGCTATATVAVTVNPLPVITLGSNSPVCEGQTLNLTSSSAGNTFGSWSKGNVSLGGSDGNKSIANVALSDFGSYTVSYTSPASCVKNSSIDVTIKPLPVLSGISSNTPVCSGNTLTFGLNATASSTYSWSGPNSFNSTTNSQSITNAGTNASGTYSVAVTLNGCVVNTTFVNVVNQTPVATVISPVTICEATQLQLNINTTPTATYAWTGPLTFTSTLQNPTVSSTATTGMTGTYSITVTLNGCTASSSVSATVKPLPTVTPTTPVSICANTPLVLNVNATVGGTYAWTGPNTFTSTLQNPTVNSLATTGMTGTYLITVTLDGCSISSSVSATVKPSPTVTPTTPVSICANTPLVLNVNATTGGTYAWSGPNTFTSTLQNPTVNSLATTGLTGTYSITVTLDGCSVSSSVSATVKPLPTVTPTTPIAVCSNTPLTLGVNATASGTYFWSGPGTFTSALQNPTVSSTATTDMTGTYSITVTLNACSVNGTASVTVNPVVNVPTANNVSIPQYTSTTLSAVCTGSTAKWYSASSGGTAIGTGSYTTPILSATTTYYVSCESGGSPNCESSTRTAQTVTITPQTTFDSANTGNWNVASTWTCSCIPDGTLPVRIMSTHIVTVPTAYTGQAKGLRFMGTGKVTLEGTGKVDVTN